MSGDQDAQVALLRETLQENVGMSQYEADVYLALVRGGAQTMSELAKSSDVPKQRVYDTVEDLRDQGFVETIDDYPRKAYAVDPSEALSDIQKQLSRAEEYLEELHESVESVENGIALFKSETTIEKYIKRLLSNAERDIFLLCPADRVKDVLSILEEKEEQRVRLIVSDLSPGSDEEQPDLDYTIPDTVDEVRVVTSTEEFVVTVDREHSFYWSKDTTLQDEDQQGYFVTNPQLTLVLDRFLSESIWPFARSIAGRSRPPSLPKEYLRIRDCLADIKDLSTSRSTNTLEVDVEGYDTETGEEVQISGTLSSYYFTEYDLRASLTLDVYGQDDSLESSLVTVGGLGTRVEDYSAYSLTLRQNGVSANELNDETKQYLDACRNELPHEFGSKSVVTGFDAFIDRMREVIGDWSDGDYERVRQFESFKESIVGFEATENAPRVEWRQTKEEAGGHVAHTGRVFDRLGYDVTIIGQLGAPIHSAFGSEFRDQTLVSIGDTSYTDYIRFDDRKLLFTEPTLDPLNWETILEYIDVEELAQYLDGVEVFSLGTLYSTPGLPSLLEGLETEVWPRLQSPPNHVHFSPGAIERFNDDLLRSSYEALGHFDDTVPVTVTANREQTRRFRSLYQDDITEESQPVVSQVRESLDISRYIVHSFHETSLANGDEVLTARAPQVVNPRQMRNVDEHFVSGISLALAENLSEESMLIIGNSVARYFMAHNEVPNNEALRSFIADYDSFFQG